MIMIAVDIPAAVNRIVVGDIVSSLALFGCCELQRPVPSHEKRCALRVHPLYLVDSWPFYKVVKSITPNNLVFPDDTKTAVFFNNARFATAATVASGTAGSTTEGGEEGGAGAPDALHGPSPTFNVVDSKQSESKDCHDGFAWDTLHYDVMRTCDKKVLFKELHLNRIQSCLQLALKDAFSLPSGPDSAEYFSASIVRYVESAVETYLKHPDVHTGDFSPECNLKWIAWIAPFSPFPPSNEAVVVETAGSALGEGQLAVYFFVFNIRSFYPPAEWYKTGARLGLLYNAARHHPTMKIVQGDLARRSLSLQRELHVYDTLLVSPSWGKFIVPEGSKSNYLLLTNDNRFLCSEKKDILLGVTLQCVIQVIEGCGIGTVFHQELYLRDLIEAKSVVSLGTSPGVLPIREIVLYKEDSSEDKAQCEEAARAGGVNLSEYMEVTECEDDKNSERARKDVIQEGEKTVSDRKKTPIVVIRKDVTNAHIERLLTEYRAASMKAYTTL